MDSESSGRHTVTPLHRPHGPRRSRRPAGGPVPAGVDTHAGGLTASFRIRYVHGPDADRIAANQAKALAALLRWLATQDRTQTTVPAPAVVDLDVLDGDVDEGKAA
ncbi:hypothetical protein [Nocardia pneumoniae]|uniref:hypothetical protein n=1 Tax=Nocardia pneumoniae TaxID=228601 RepID=UPI0012F673BE|nr:hypothetical protein [Nocardia pneumoniae]